MKNYKLLTPGPLTPTTDDMLMIEPLFWQIP